MAGRGCSAPLALESGSPESIRGTHKRFREATCQGRVRHAGTLFEWRLPLAEQENERRTSSPQPSPPGGGEGEDAAIGVRSGGPGLLGAFGVRKRQPRKHSGHA
ncbi:hypothetical protein SBV1_3000010 [Verrucomicrobia bacterium]|nr:hypothetical protein SBV1_3000010 [Verrucomicrobiota bacterium]